MKKGVEGWKWYEMGEGVFKGTESSGHPAKGAYVQYYYTAVQRLSCSIRLVLLTVCLCTIHRVQCTIYQRMLGGPLAYGYQKVAYVCTKRQRAYVHLT
jgi:hypothetical protein